MSKALRTTALVGRAFSIAVDSTVRRAAVKSDAEPAARLVRATGSVGFGLKPLDFDTIGRFVGHSFHIGPTPPAGKAEPDARHTRTSQGRVSLDRIPMVSYVLEYCGGLASQTARLLAVGKLLEVRPDVCHGGGGGGIT